MEDLKFRVHNPEHSKAIQKRLFELGYKWSVNGKKPSHLEAVGLYAGEDKIITYTEFTDTFEKSINKEATLNDLYKNDVILVNKKTKELQEKITYLQNTGHGIVDVLKDLIAEIEIIKKKLENL